MNRFKTWLGCYEGWASCNGRSYTMSKISDALRFRFRNFMHDLPRGFRWWLSGRLSWLACKVRGEKWYVADAWHGVPGNRASELQQQIWQEWVICINDPDDVNRIDAPLKELAQAAGENWGHVWPKENTSNENPRT